MDDWTPIDGEAMPDDGRHLVTAEDEGGRRTVMCALFSSKTGWWFPHHKRSITIVACIPWPEPWGGTADEAQPPPWDVPHQEEDDG